MWSIGAIVILVVVVAILWLMWGSSLTRRACKPKCSATMSAMNQAMVGETPMDCSLFQAIYLPWTPVPTVWKPKEYQPSVANFLFRACWNVTTTNCFEHRFDFEPPKTFDTVVRIMTPFGRMYAYWLHSSERRLGVLVFTGTAFTDDWAKNLVYAQVPPVTLNNVSVTTRCHAGFYGIYSQVQNEIRKLVTCSRSCTDRLVITGYSLGSALATLAAMDLAKERPLLYAIGGPRVFNPAGAKLLNSLVPDNFRVFNTEDIVTQLPFAVSGENMIKDPLSSGDIIYEHVGRPIAWTDSHNTLLDDHSRAYELFLLSDGKPPGCSSK
jgi:hypothetical protein